jgi:hypothetical protein
MPKLVKYVAMLLVFSMVMGLSPLANAAYPKILTKSEKEEIQGGVVCGAIVVIGVVGAVCSIVGLGYMVVREFYNGKTDGNKSLSGTTVVIKRKTVWNGDSCSTTEDITVTHYTVNP